MLTESDVLEALRVCFDPELPVNIVDLGLVHRMFLTRDEEAPGFEPRFHVRILLLKRTADEVREAMMQAQIGNRLAGIRYISSVSIELLREPVWSASRMSEAARHLLGLNRPAPQGLVEIKLP